MFADKNVPKDEKHFEDVLHEKWGPEGSIMLTVLIGLPFLIAGVLWLISATESLPPDVQGSVMIGFLLPIAVATMIPSVGIFILIDHLWERKIKRTKAKKAQEQFTAIINSVNSDLH